MKVGISTASLFNRKPTEDALAFLRENKVSCAEVFLESYCEYSNEFGSLLSKVKGDVDVHSVHVLTTQFEPQLYSINQRAQNDSFKLLDMAMSSAELIGAKYYTFHGGARFKKTPFKIDFERVGAITQKVIDCAKKHGITLAYENVHWGYYNYIGFFKELKKRTVGLKGTLDIKQARQSGISYIDYLNEMQGDIVTVHLSDIDSNGKMRLPLKGITDFNELFLRLNDVGFDGALLIEAYTSDYDSLQELLECRDNLDNLASKIF
ncbi:MAG: sugar phosphate isomerase/epimerase [Clostridiales bacterium]|nr:sugar phosphate isomerase/epimerase [Clostridiales bacterium]